MVLMTLRQRGDIFLDHEAAGLPAGAGLRLRDVVWTARTCRFPATTNCCASCRPRRDVIDAAKRPYIIIDPRAGHGAGIGGFKTDSQVGVALRGGHPVYFVAFRRARARPVPGLRHARRGRLRARGLRRHPDAPKPIVIGNCQGGWATLLLAATNPDLTGPIVINGAPVAPWSGEVGENPMRYNAGVLGGTWIPMFCRTSAAASSTARIWCRTSSC
jgi:pimeloyl-ACP methyl ester carboxylesterase